MHSEHDAGVDVIVHCIMFPISLTSDILAWKMNLITSPNNSYIDFPQDKCAFVLNLSPEEF